MWGSTNTESGVPPKHLWPAIGEEEVRSEMEVFVDCIEAGEESEMNAEIAAESVAVIAAGYRSAATGEVVSIS